MSRSKRPELAPLARPNLSQTVGKTIAPKRPDIAALLAVDTTPVPNPIEGIPTGVSLEVDAQVEVSAILQAFKDRAKREQERFDLAADSEFWFAVCFQSREQKEAFLVAMEWIAGGDKYLDGPKLAADRGIKLPSVELRKGKRRVDRVLASMTKRR